MSLVEKIANNIGKKTKCILDFDDDTEEIVIYGAMNLIQTTLSFLLIIIIGFVFGVVYEALMFTITVSVLKKYSGGPHASSSGRCLFISSIISVSFGLLISKILCKQNICSITIAGVLCIIISVYIIIKKAPIDSENKPITSKKMRQRLKRNSIVVVLIYLIIMAISLIALKVLKNIIYIKIFECIGIAVLWQAITLTKPTIKFIHKVDSLLQF